MKGFTFFKTPVKEKLAAITIFRYPGLKLAALKTTQPQIDNSWCYTFKLIYSILFIKQK